MALTEGIDRSIFLGDSGATPNASDIVGLNTAAGLTEKELTQAEKVKGSDVLAEFASLIDGKSAMMPSDLKSVFSVGSVTRCGRTNSRIPALLWIRPSPNFCGGSG